MKAADNDPDFESLLEFLKQTRGFDFTGYKRPSLMRRVKRRMQTVGIEDHAGYLDYLQVHPHEFTYLFNTILINVTEFYRDAPAWNYLAAEGLARVIDRKPADTPIRCWCAGCASGEEVYTLAMVLSETLGEQTFRRRVKIYATDVDEEALNKARKAHYTEKEVRSVPEALRHRYFEVANGAYVFRPDLRRSIIFGRLDLVQDAPISRLDLLVCRNTLMYFNAETQTHILARFHFSLNEFGLLFVSRAEMLLTHAYLFAPVSIKHRLFAKVPNTKVNARDRMAVPSHAGTPESSDYAARNLRLQELAFDKALPVQLVLDAHGHLVLADQAARRLFSLTAQELGHSFRDLPLFSQLAALLSQIEQAYARQRPTTLKGIEWRGQGGETRYFNIQVTPLLEPGGLLGIAVSYTDVTKQWQLEADYQRTTQELETAQEELQSTNEELETTNEELQSANEELETINEELQSANEELETTNDELRSTNEQLHALNQTLHQRSEALDQTNAFMESILFSLHAAAVALDRDCTILSWNEGAVDLWGLRAGEVRGQNLLKLDLGLPVERLQSPIKRVLSAGRGHEIIELEAINRRGKPVHCKITLTPLLNDPQQAVTGVLLLMEPQPPQDKRASNTTA